MAKYERAEDQLKVTPGLSVVVAESDQQAQDQFGELQSLVDFSNLEFGGFDLSGYPLDGPLPDLPYQAGDNGKGRFLQQLELARRDNLTLRQLVLRFRVARGHLQAIGSVKTVADLMEQWFAERGADGFNVVPPLLPQGFEAFTRLGGAGTAAARPVPHRICGQYPARPFGTGTARQPAHGGGGAGRLTAV